jgi:hypothetical protein
MAYIKVLGYGFLRGLLLACFVIAVSIILSLH